MTPPFRAKLPAYLVKAIDYVTEAPHAATDGEQAAVADARTAPGMIALPPLLETFWTRSEQNWAVAILLERTSRPFYPA